MKLCGVTTCGKKNFCKGFCKAHYERWTKHGDVLAHVPIMKRVIRGGKKSPEYVAWFSMMTRCYKKHRDSHRYAGRGITVCEEWHILNTFLQDMGKRPSLKHSLDRIDNNKGYSPENCRWATKLEQGRNKERVVQDAERQLMKNLRAAGLTYAQIAEKIGRSVSAVFNNVD